MGQNRKGRNDRSAYVKERQGAEEPVFGSQGLPFSQGKSIPDDPIVAKHHSFGECSGSRGVLQHDDIVWLNLFHPRFQLFIGDILSSVP